MISITATSVVPPRQPVLMNAARVIESKRQYLLQVGPQRKFGQRIAQPLTLRNRLLPVADTRVVTQSVVREILAVRQLAARQAVHEAARRPYQDHVVEPVALLVVRGAAAGATPRQRLVEPAGDDAVGEVRVQYQAAVGLVRDA